MKTLFFFHHQNLLLDASAIFQNPVLLCIIATVALYLTFQGAKAHERYSRYRSINNLFNNMGGSNRQGPTTPVQSTATDFHPRKKGMPGAFLSLVVVFTVIAFTQYTEYAPTNRQAIQTSNHSSNTEYNNINQPTKVKSTETYVNRSPRDIVGERNLEAHTYRPEQDFIPRSKKEETQPQEEYKVQHASMYSAVTGTVNAPTTSTRPLYTIQVTSASDHHQVRIKAYDYSKEFPRTDVFTYQQGGITKLFIGEYFSEKEMRLALKNFKKTLNQGAFPVALNSIDTQLLQTTY